MSHYYSKEQDSALRLYRIKANLLSSDIEFVSASGIFSARKLDKGTEILIKGSTLKDGWRVLDLGCGCGIVGLTVATAYPGSKVLMSDINKRAVRIAGMNIKSHSLANAEAVFSDRFENISGLFDTILLNPPMSAGRKLCFGMIQKSADYLKKKGLLQVVARHNKGGRAISEKMMEVFGNMSTAAKKSGFRVYVSIKK